VETRGSRFKASLGKKKLVRPSSQKQAGDVARSYNPSYVGDIDKDHGLSLVHAKVGNPIEKAN
jgi:hypothetical protein